jgi:hypothetical protein
MRDANRFENTRGKKGLEGPSLVGEIILKWILNKYRAAWTVLTCLDENG